jgi:site-specific recombinase XerD
VQQRRPEPHHASALQQEAPHTGHSHHKVGRHSVASQAVTAGTSVKAVQAHLGHLSEQSTHKYSHLGSGAQKRLVEALKPTLAPHERESHVNVASTGAGSPLEQAS